MKKPTRHVYVFDDGERTWIVAETKERAWEYYRETYGSESIDVEVRKLPDARRLTIGFEDGPPEEPKSQTQTAAEWALEHEGGLLASTGW